MTSISDGRRLGHAFAQHFAASEGRLEQVVRYVEKSGVEINAQESKTRDTMLHRAARGCHADVVDWLCAHRASPAPRNAQNRAALHEAAAAGCVPAVRSLLQSRAELTPLDKARQTPLHRAAACGRAEACAALLDYRADGEGAVLPATAGARPEEHVAMRDALGYTALHLAAKHGHLACVVALLARGATHSSADRVGNMPLHDATRAGSAECVACLLRAGADPEAKDRKGRTAAQAGAGCAAIKRVFESGGELLEEAALPQEAPQREPDQSRQDKPPQQAGAEVEEEPSLPRPEYRWEPRPAGAFGQARAALVVALPLCDSGAGVALDVAEQELTLGVADKYALRAPLPFAVDSESTRAKFSRREKTMTITVEQRI